MRFGTCNQQDRANRIVTIVVLTLIAQGCCTYRSADHDQGVAQLLGHRCVVTQSASFPEGGGHWHPSFHPPYAYPPVVLEPGTILRVSHVELWDGPIDPSGSIVYAEVENGAKRGSRVVIGTLGNLYDLRPALVIWCVDPPGGVSVAAGRCLTPLTRIDEGVFFTGDFKNGIVYNLTPLRWH